VDGRGSISGRGSCFPIVQSVKTDWAHTTAHSTGTGALSWFQAAVAWN
jgi:hypothetical protein